MGEVYNSCFELNHDWDPVFFKYSRLTLFFLDSFLKQLLTVEPHSLPNKSRIASQICTHLPARVVENVQILLDK